VDPRAASSADRTGKPRAIAEAFDVSEAAACLRYYGGWADKNSGRIQEVHDQKLALIRHEPIGVVGQIIPWNFPSTLPVSLTALTAVSPHVRLVRQRHRDLTDAAQEDRPGARDRQRHRHEGALYSMDELTIVDLGEHAALGPEGLRARGQNPPEGRPQRPDRLRQDGRASSSGSSALTRAGPGHR